MTLKRIFFLVFAISVWHQSSDAALSVETLTREIESSKKRLELQEEKRQKTLAGLFHLNQKIRQSVQERSVLQNEKNELTSSIESYTDRLEELSDSSNQLKNRLIKRLQTLSKIKTSQAARFILASKNASQFDRHMKILQMVNLHDRQLIMEYDHSQKEIKIKRQKLNARLASLEKNQMKMQQVVEKLGAEQKIKNNILAGIRKRKIFTLQSIANMRKQGRTLSAEQEGIIDTILQPSFGEQKGLLSWPVEGFVRRPFGPWKNADRGWVVSNKGVFLSAKEGSPVRTVFPGKVVFVENLPSLLTTVIIDHGDHYLSILSQLKEPTVQVGQTLLEGDVIGRVSRSRIEDQSGLYFEIRHFSEPDDPQSWMKGSSI